MHKFFHIREEDDSMKSKVKIGAFVLAASLTLAACSSNSGDNADKNANWGTFGYDLELTRHVPFTQIKPDNLKDLGVIWSQEFKKLNDKVPNGNQSFPIVIDGIAYVTTAESHVFAFEATTGKVVWQWSPPQEVLDAYAKYGMPSSNRGVAVGEGKVFIITGDNGLAAIDQKTGKTIKLVHFSEYESMKDVTAENGYYETTAPIYHDGLVFVGSSGADNGVRGFEMAFKASDLTPAWDEPVWNVPPKGQDWLAEGLFGGGGTVWMPPAIDNETGLMYFASANPAPDFYGEKRPGANPNTNSIIAVEYKTGKLVWVRQQIAHDLWDYDSADSPAIITATINGEKRKVVVEGNKGGLWYAFDAATGETVYENVPFGKIDHPDPTPEGVLTYPGILGGQNYAPDTYDPEANLVLIPGIESPTITKTAKNEEEAAKSPDFFGIWAFGTSYAPAPEGTESYGTITAIDLNTGKQAYQIKTKDMMRGGLTSTATGITFYGELDGHVKAIETKTGKELWSFQTGGDSISAAPSIFTHKGKEYIMITTGGEEPQVYVFGLGGDKTEGEASKSYNPTANVHDSK